MDLSKRRRIRNVAIGLLGLFCALFVLRWMYEIFFSDNDIIIPYWYEESSFQMQSNVATDRVKQKDVAGKEIEIDQKYVKAANLSSYATDFADANQTLRAYIDAHEAVIQLENLSGLEGSQVLAMTIGVMPDRFDAMVEDVKSIGELRSFTVNKVDKTSEYRTLMAEKETLEKTQASYAQLKEKGGNIQDLLLLEEKILEIERSLQGIGVSAGIFATENSFCTVNLTIYETAAPALSVRFALSRAPESFIWAIAAFALIVVLALGVLACAFGFVCMSDRLRRPASAKADVSGRDDVSAREEEHPEGRQ